MTALTMIKLSKLIPDAAINTRVTARGAEIEALADNIRNVGLLLPLSVRKSDKGYAIIDGHRRHAALLLVHTDPDIEVPALVQDVGNAAAHTMSLSANIMRVPLHPVDQYRAFARLVDEGATAEDVAQTFGVTVKMVKQRMAMGNVIDPVIDAYLDEKIDLEIIKLFAAEPKTKQQALWDQIADDNLHRYQINQLFSDASYTHRDPIVKFVGREAYVNAGGEIIGDLFGEGGEKWTDVPLAQRLAAERIVEVKQMLLDTGWQFVVSREKDGLSRWQYQNIKGEPVYESSAHQVRIEALQNLLNDGDLEPEIYDQREQELYELEDKITYSFTPEIKARSGVFITTDYELIYGMIAPSRQAKEEKKAGATEAKEEGISQALMADIKGVLTESVQFQLARSDSPLTLPLLLLSMISEFEGHYATTLSLSSNLRHKREQSLLDQTIRDQLDAALLPEGSLIEKLKLLSHPDWEPHVLRLLKLLTARMLVTLDNTDPLLELLVDELGVVPGLYKLFDLERQSHFERIPSKMIEAALKKTGTPIPKKFTKKALAALAADKTRNALWLPELLVYKAPKAKLKKKAA